MQQPNINKDTIVTTSSNILSERTINLKKEIINLDEEIIMLQNSLQNAMIHRSGSTAILNNSNLYNSNQ